MKGKTVVMTGGTSGIGEVAAEKLAQMGARVVLVARDKSRGEGTLARLRTRAPNLGHRVHYADLTRISEMKRVATEIAEAEPRIDVLINNAGAMFATRKLTEDGLEFTFALNHMAYFVVTQGLRERLVASAPARVVNTASVAHQGASLEFDDLQLTESFGAMKAYGRSKLCNILFTRELARRLHGTGVTANCLHPGFVATRFGDESGGLISRLNMNLDTNDATGKLMLQIIGSIAEFQRSIMLSRQLEGIAKAKAEGKYRGGVPTARAKAAHRSSLWLTLAKPREKRRKS